MDAGGEPVDEGDVDQAAEEVASALAAFEDSALVADALDGRAAAAAGARELGTRAIGLDASSWYSGVIAPGQMQHWYWNNASLTTAYMVGLSPVGAPASGDICELRVVRTWDVQRPDGEREFHFVIQNVNSVTCGANILLQWKQRSSTWAMGVLNAGAQQGWIWNNANPLDAAFFVGVSPTGATSSNPCQLEITKTWYEQQPGGEREFHFVVKNIGAIACQGNIQLAQTTLASKSWGTLTLSPGATDYRILNDANPLDRVYVTGLSPSGASGSNACQLEVTEASYVQWVDPDGNTERIYLIVFKNIGTLACSGTVLVNHL
jgi:hypothetical protein